MICYGKIEYKNFLSVGENPVTIDLKANRTTLMVGGNGEGKSILLDALSFVQFNKPHRKVTKTQLVNTINGKGTLVTLWFSIGKTEYRIVRGIKPNIFEIYKNDVLIDQSNTARDYQKILEQNILKLNHKSFHQIVVLGSSTFIPFMELTAGSRREVIEDLLDIGVFSKMNMILKEKKKVLKSSLVSMESELSHINSQITTQKRHIEQIEALSQSNDDRIQEDINTLDREIEEMKSQGTAMRVEFEELDCDGIDALSKHRSKLLSYDGKYRGNMGPLKDDLKFFADNDVCPTCSQSISQELKDDVKHTREKKLRSLQGKCSAIEEEMKKTEAKLSKLTVIQRKQTELSSQMSSLARTIKSKMREKVAKESSLVESKVVQDASESKNELKRLVVEHGEREDKHIKLIEKDSYMKAMELMLKDKGIKTRIIAQYLPTMNKLINQYLELFGFFVSFTLDAEFNECIKSRHRDKFSYASFSEGQKSRINLALMFTWRQIARMKNSANTNLLVLDEVMDSSLDSCGLEALSGIFKTIDDGTNVFVISHRDDLKGSPMFDRTLCFTKTQLFTEVSCLD